MPTLASGTRITAIALLGLIACTLRAQETPERTLGEPTVIGAEPFRNIASVRELSDGRLLVVERGPLDALTRGMMSAFVARGARGGRGGRGGRGAGPDSASPRPEPPHARVLVFDAKLQGATPVGEEGTAPGDYQQPQTLIRDAADTTLLLDLGRGDLAVIDPNARIVGTKPVPGGGAALLGIGGIAIDHAGRLLFESREQVTRNTPRGMESGFADSTAITAFDFRTEATIPVAHVRVAGTTALMEADSSAPGRMKMHAKMVPFPVIDDWVMMPDGTLAIIRGSDLHIDWIAPNGKMRSTRPIAYARQEVSDSDKALFRHRIGLTDSMPMLFGRLSITEAEPDSFPHFKPPFSTRDAKAALDGTIWIPSKIISPAAPAGYAIIGPDGRVREIVHFAKGQRLLGFGKGVAYVAVNEGPRNNRVARVSLR
jgi:hypothetical protein